MMFVLTVKVNPYHPFVFWIHLLGDERLAAALLDRLTYRAHIVELTGESFRFRQRVEEKEA